MMILVGVLRSAEIYEGLVPLACALIPLGRLLK
jgi:hypothetical protein